MQTNRIWRNFIDTYFRYCPLIFASDCISSVRDKNSSKNSKRGNHVLSLELLNLPQMNVSCFQPDSWRVFSLSNVRTYTDACAKHYCTCVLREILLESFAIPSPSAFRRKASEQYLRIQSPFLFANSSVLAGTVKAMCDLVTSRTGNRVVDKYTT